MRKLWLKRSLFGLVLLTPFLLTREVPAGFSKTHLQTFVEIDGVNYGSFDELKELEKTSLNKDSITHVNSFKAMRLKRDFVTERSLYFWAKKTLENRLGLKDLHLILKDAEGYEISRYILHSCQPLSWTMEASNPALGGYYETIDLAVQEISVQ